MGNALAGDTPGPATPGRAPTGGFAALYIPFAGIPPQKSEDTARILLSAGSAGAAFNKYFPIFDNSP